ncbi:MAG: DUF72 domain-containing protein [Desulfobacteraceae bacterium]|nr:MAG: DUF72 domain-containing protein [Desulfobacteraceae bacterium]
MIRHIEERQTNIHIGTSGWHYRHWKGTFYPKELSEKKFLDYYANHFQSVEINNSFYQIPKKESLLAWRNAVPSGFIFTVKASRFITHRKKLKDPEETLELFLDTISSLNDKLGPVLFQLPPSWGFNAERFYDFLESLPAGFRFAFEFRNPTWNNTQAYDALTEIGAAFCISDYEGTLSPKNITADFVYVRLHGPDEPYRGGYSTTALSGWAGAVSAWVDQGREVFLYFDNDEEGHAVRDALKLKNMLNSGTR